MADDFINKKRVIDSITPGSDAAVEPLARTVTREHLEEWEPKLRDNSQRNVTFITTLPCNFSYYCGCRNPTPRRRRGCGSCCDLGFQTRLQYERVPREFRAETGWQTE